MSKQDDELQGLLLVAMYKSDELFKLLSLIKDYIITSNSKTKKDDFKTIASAAYAFQWMVEDKIKELVRKNYEENRINEIREVSKRVCSKFRILMPK